MKRLISNTWGQISICVLFILVIIFFIPEEKTLGSAIRMIYLHGAWVWTGVILYILAGIAGLIAVVARKQQVHRWSAAFGRIAVFFFITYLPMALLVMQQNWNGLFFAEPRWSIPFSLTVASVLVQTGIYFINQPVLTSLINMGFGTLLVMNFTKLQSVLHPESPIQQSGSMLIKVMFYLVLVMTTLMGMVLSRWIFHWHLQHEKRNQK